MKYDVVATIGTYEKDGQTKYLTQRVGQVFETKNGPKLKLAASFNPAGCKRDDDGMVWLALFEPKARDDAPSSTTRQPEPTPFDDTVPF